MHTHTYTYTYIHFMGISYSHIILDTPIMDTPIVPFIPHLWGAVLGTIHRSTGEGPAQCR